MKKAIVEKNKVVQVVDNAFPVANNVEFVDCDETVLSGDGFVDGKFVKEFKAQRPFASQFKNVYIDTETGMLVYFNGVEVKNITLEQIETKVKTKGVKKNGK
jgi:hypothetical protein